MFLTYTNELPYELQKVNNASYPMVYPHYFKKKKGKTSC